MLKKNELKEIEEKIKELESQKKALLDEAKNAEKARKAERKKEVEDAYNNFLKLLKAYEDDFGGGYKVSISGNLSI